ncbi:MAG TPA: ATP-binding protein [Mobilitalea sp.]|nr:ATP-binding protein [Mobilitalea sp.]
MKKKKNRRTLRKRIRRVLSLSTFLTVIFISGIMIFIVLYISKSFVTYQVEEVSEAIQEEIRTGRAVQTLEIRNVAEMDPKNSKTRDWIAKLDRSSAIKEIIPYSSDIPILYIRLEINDKLLFSNEDGEEEELSGVFNDTTAVKPIYDVYQNQIGSITVRVNPEIIFSILGVIIIFITVLSIGALIISNILRHFLIIPIINPIKQLEKKVKAISIGDHEAADNALIVVKKPLREIESLADSTNAIMRRLNGYNEILENQKEILENQNAELEVQNDELLESKRKIQKQQAQLIQSEKMASVGMLTAAITHEINTPMGAINSNAQLVDMQLMEIQNCPSVNEDEGLMSILNGLKEVNDVNLMACSRIIEIIKSLKSFSRLDQSEYKEAYVNEGIKSVLVLTHNLLKQRITVYEDYEDIPPVKCFPGQLNQVIMNIVVNASQAIVGEGDIFIHTYQEESFICISIKDTGTGIAEENISKIFEPAFTTKGVGIGLGLGLYISYNIIENHNGEISVSSEQGKGTEFIIKIPIDMAHSNDSIDMEHSKDID